MTWDEVKELGPLYALGALDNETARKVEDFLHKATPEQKRELLEWGEVVSLIPLALPTTQPSASVKERLMSRIAAEQSSVVSGTDIPQSTSNVKQFPARQTESSMSRWLLLAATVLLTLTSGYLFWKNAQLENERNKLAVALDRIQSEYTTVVAPTTKVLDMIGDEAPQASAKLVWDKKLQTWVIYIYNLPEPPADKVYQLWYVTDKDAKISAEIFRTDQKGEKKLQLRLPPDIATGLAATAVTLEPRGGSEQPTGKMYLKAAI